MDVDDSSAPIAIADAGVMLGEGISKSAQGIYELHGVVTHKGRSADSGEMLYFYAFPL